MRTLAVLALLAGLACAVGAVAGVRGCDVAAVGWLVVAELLLPEPPGPRKYP